MQLRSLVRASGDLESFGVIEQIQVKIHFARMLWLKCANLQLKGDQGLGVAVVEQQINELLFLAQLQAVLATNKAEAVAWLLQERL
jgi:hypothetical protein